MESNTEESEREASGPLLSDARSEAGDGRRSDVACSSNTQLQTRQEEEEERGEAEKERNAQKPLVGVTGVDWWQLAACVEWNPEIAAPWFAVLNEAKETAQVRRQPVPLTIGEDIVVVHARGAGKGRDAYKEIQLSWNGGIAVGLSQRTNATRQMSNAALTVSGEPCLVVGWGTSWEFFHRLVAAIGGEITDEWIKRLDLCLDFPEVGLNESLGDALRNQQFVATVRKSSFHQNPDGIEGFAVGKSNRVRVLIYDKLADVLTNHGPVYRQAMIEKRWGGCIPSKATRVEFQIGRSWLHEYGLRKSDCIGRIRDIYDKLTVGPNPALRVTAEPVDRENRHQDRAVTLPIWEQMIAAGREYVGQEESRLVRIDRSKLDEARAAKQIVGFATSIADRRQWLCTSVDDSLDVIRKVLEANGITDEYIRSKFEPKAKASGTWQELFQFPPKECA